MTLDNLMGLVIGAIIGEYCFNYPFQAILGQNYNPQLTNVFWYTIVGYIFHRVFFS